MTHEPTNQPTEKLDFKRVLPIFIIVLVDLLGLTIILPLLPLYATAFGASPFVIGLLAATYPLMQFIGAPVLGRLSDQHGRKPILVISQIGTLIGFLLLAGANSLLMLFISRFIDGLSGANIATAQAAISDVTTEKTRTQGLGLVGAAFGLGFIIGPIIAFASLAASGNNYHVPALAAAFFSLLSILLTAFWFKETLPEEDHGQNKNQKAFSLQALYEGLRHPAVGFLLILMFSQQLVFGGFEQLLALFTLERLGFNASGNAILFVFLGLIVVGVQGGAIGKWSRRFGDIKLIYGGLALLAIGLAFAAFTPRQPLPWYSQAAIEEELNSQEDGRIQPNQIQLPPDDTKGWLGTAWLLLVLIPVAIGGSVLRPTINSVITKRVSPLEIGGMLGISTAFSSLANFVAPIMGGAIFQWAGATALFLIWGVAVFILLLIARQKLVPAADSTPQPDPE